MARSQQFRAEFGFPSDIESTLAGMAAGNLKDGPFTAAEVQAMIAQEETLADPTVAEEYGQAHSTEYGGLWLDRPGRDTFVIAFTDNLSEHADALVELMGDIPFRVERVEHSLESLQVEQQKAIDALHEWGEINFASGSGNALNRVTLDIGYLDPDELAFLAERLDPTMVCVSGTSDPPMDEVAQRTEGAGWRLLADETRGSPYTVAVASNTEELAKMWGVNQLETPLPAVDFASEVVLLFTQAVSGSCPSIRFDDLIVDADRVYAVFLYPGDYVACRADANPHSYVVAVDRAVLPGRFQLQLTDGDACPGCATDSMLVDLNDPPTVSTSPSTSGTGAGHGLQIPVLLLDPARAAVGAGQETVPESTRLLDSAARQLVHDLGGVAVAEGDDPSKGPEVCNSDQLHVSWSPPEGDYEYGGYIPPLGPPMDVGTERAAGIVTCTGVTYSYVGFEAFWRPSAATWELYPIPSGD